MTHQASARAPTSSADAGQEVAQLRHILQLVAQIGGSFPARDPGEAMLDENARISSAYSDAPAIVRRRFDALTAETATWAAVAVQALVAARDATHPPRAAARLLADELGAALRRMRAILEA